MIKAVTKQNELIGKFGGYIDFIVWLEQSEYAVIAINKPLYNLKRDNTGTVTLEPINNVYLQKLHIKEV